MRLYQRGFIRSRDHEEPLPGPQSPHAAPVDSGLSTPKRCVPAL